MKKGLSVKIISMSMMAVFLWFNIAIGSPVKERSLRIPISPDGQRERLARVALEGLGSSGFFYELEEAFDDLKEGTDERVEGVIRTLTSKGEREGLEKVTAEILSNPAEYRVALNIIEENSPPLSEIKDMILELDQELDPNLPFDRLLGLLSREQYEILDETYPEHVITIARWIDLLEYYRSGKYDELDHPVALSSDRAGMKPYNSETLDGMAREWEEKGRLRTYPDIQPSSYAPHLEAMLSSMPEENTPKAFMAFAQVVDFLRNGKAGEWDIEIVGVRTIDSGSTKLLAVGDPEKGIEPLRVMSRRLEEGGRKIIRVYVPQNIIAAEHESAPYIARAVLHQAPASAFQQDTVPPRADLTRAEGPAARWWVSAAEIQACKKEEVFGESLSPIQARDLHAAVETGNVAYLRGLIETYYELYITPREREYRGKVDWPAYDAAVKNSYALAEASVNAIRDMSHREETQYPDISGDDRAWISATLKFWDEPDVIIAGAGGTGLTIADALSKAGKSVHLYDPDGLGGGAIRWGILEREGQDKGSLKDPWIGSTWRAGIRERDYVDLLREEDARLLTILRRSNVRLFGGRKVADGGISIEELRKKGIVVILATGAHVSDRLHVPGEPKEGEDLDGYWPGLDVSAWAARDRRILHERGFFGWYPDDPEEKNVIVVGFGDIAANTVRNAASAHVIDPETVGADEINLIARGGAEALQIRTPQLEAFQDLGFEIHICTSNLKVEYEDYKEQVLALIAQRVKAKIPGAKELQRAVQKLFEIAIPVDLTAERSSEPFEKGKKILTIRLYTVTTEILTQNKHVRGARFQQNYPKVVVEGEGEDERETIQFNKRGRAMLDPHYYTNITLDATRVVPAIGQHPYPTKGVLTDDRHFIATQEDGAELRSREMGIEHFTALDENREPLDNVYAAGWVVTKAKGLLGAIRGLGDRLAVLLLEKTDGDGMMVMVEQQGRRPGVDTDI